MAEPTSGAWKGLHAVVGGWMLRNPLRRRRLAPFVGKVIAALPDEGTVLDVGAGNGAVTLQIARKAAGARIIALDLSASMLGKLRALAEREGLGERIETRVADAAATGLEPESVDVVTCTYLLHELPDPSAAIGEMVRVLRPGGRLLLRDFAPGRTFSLMTIFGRFHHKDAHGPLGEEELRAALGSTLSFDIERSGSEYTVSCAKEAP